MKKFTYKHTIYSCFIGYIVLAIINNFLPLLFVTIRSNYGISLSQITLLITFNFLFQLIVDAASAVFIDRIGYRMSMILANVAAAIGFVLLSFLPDLMSNHFLGILIADIIYAMGGGLLEVLVSPIVEACPTERKEKAMSLLHSFYCWGHVGVVAFSTLFFSLFEIENWKWLALIWAVLPTINIFMFTKVPLNHLVMEDEAGLTIRELLSKKLFLLIVFLMFLAGASEQAVSQWASVFVEKSLGISKTISDLAGPLVFAVMMGLSRLYFGKCEKKIDLFGYIRVSTILCIFSYVLISVFSMPAIGLIGCGLCGLSVGILWPGTFSLAAKTIKNGGTAMFALMALAGDVGCMTGPSYAGFISNAFKGNIQIGILFSIIFPIVSFVGYMAFDNIVHKRRI